MWGRRGASWLGGQKCLVVQVGGKGVARSSTQEVSAVDTATAAVVAVERKEVVSTMAVGVNASSRE